MSRRGFSLIEIVAAVAVVAIGILAICGALAFGLRGGEQGDRMNHAVAYGQRLISLLRVQNRPFATDPPVPMGREPLEAPPYQNDFPASSGFEREILMERLKPVQNGAPDDYRHNVMRVVVILHWEERGVDHSLRLETFHREPEP